MTDSDQAQPLPDPQAEPTGVLPPEPARSGRRGLGERLSGRGALIGTGLGALALGLVLGGAGGFAIGHADGWDRPPGLHQGFDDYRPGPQDRFADRLGPGPGMMPQRPDCPAVPDQDDTASPGATSS